MLLSADIYSVESLDVVIVGGGISGLVTAFQAHKKGLSYRLLEGSLQWGGAIRSISSLQGMEEAGPETLVARPVALDLVRELGLESQLLPAQAELPMLVCRNGQLLPLPEGFRHLLPTGPRVMFESPILSGWAKLRLLMEPFVGVGQDEDESLASFVRRRLGLEVLENMVQPVVTALHGADPENLSMLAVFPKLLKMEREHGSLFNGFRRRTMHTPARTWPLLGMRQGLGQLVARLRQQLRHDWLRSECLALSVSPLDGGGWEVRGRQQVFHCRHLVLATPAPICAQLLQPLAPAMAELIEDIRCRSLAVVCQAWLRCKIQIPPLVGTLLVPLSQGLCWSACTFPHLKWPSRTPWDIATLRILVGGSGREQYLQQDDQSLADQVLRQLGRFLKLEGTPTKTMVVRHPQLLPEYRVGHHQRMGRLLELGRQWPGLHLAGNWLVGVGLADCIQRAVKVGQELKHSHSDRRVAS